eukprot:364904-Chlamydomonas_euryale.AAC.7
MAHHVMVVRQDRKKRTHRNWFAAPGLLSEVVRAVHTYKSFLPAVKNLNSHACERLHRCLIAQPVSHVP